MWGECVLNSHRTGLHPRRALSLVWGECKEAEGGGGGRKEGGKEGGVYSKKTEPHTRGEEKASKHADRQGNRVP